MKDTNKELLENVNEVLNTSYTYIGNAIPLVKSLADRFYQSPNKDAWDKLVDLFGGIGWVIETLTEIDSINRLGDIIEEYETWNEYVQRVSTLSDIIPEMEGALEIEDNILIADLLLYEIVPNFEDMIEKLIILNPRVVSKDVN